MIIDALFSSEKDCWETPDDLFDYLDQIYKFNIDVAASDDNAKCIYFITEDADALSTQWLAWKYEYDAYEEAYSLMPYLGRAYCNPPYGRNIGEWLSKAIKEVQWGSAELVVMLLPARTDTKWFHEYVLPYASKIYFIKGRLKFKGASNSAPFPSMIAVFDPDNKPMITVETLNLKEVANG